jgi:hypothetical protein
MPSEGVATVMRAACDDDDDDDDDNDGGGLSNIYIDGVARRCAVNGTFCGVFSSDAVPEDLAERGSRFSLVCNLSREHEKGTHFVVVACTPRRVYYLDPTGLPCTNTELLRFLAHCGRRRRRLVYCNSKTIQHPLSSFCGFYALLFVLRFDRGARWQTLLFADDHRDSTDLFANDALCLHYLKCEIVTAMTEG